MEDCIADAKAQGRSGVCMLGARRQEAWLTDQRFVERFGFQPVDETEDGYTLLALRFDGAVPRFTESARRQRVDWDKLAIYYDDQCPFIAQRVERIRAHCLEQNIPARIVRVEALEQAKALPFGTRRPQRAVRPLRRWGFHHRAARRFRDRAR